MSYEIIKHIKIDEKENKVMINCASNNVYPRDYHYFECKSLGKILKDQDRIALDIEILKILSTIKLTILSGVYTTPED